MSLLTQELMVPNFLNYFLLVIINLFLCFRKRKKKKIVPAPAAAAFDFFLKIVFVLKYTPVLAQGKKKKKGRKGILQLQVCFTIKQCFRQVLCRGINHRVYLTVISYFVSSPPTQGPEARLLVVIELR